MVKVERAYIKVSASLNQSAIAIHDNFVKVYGEAAYSYLSAARWAASSKVGESNLEDEICTGRPITETVKSNIDLVESLIGINPGISYSYLEEQTFLSRGTLN